MRATRSPRAWAFLAAVALALTAAVAAAFSLSGES